MKDINREMPQTFVAKKRQALSAKTVRNLLAPLSMMWVHAKADGYTQIEPFDGLVLPEPELIDEPFLTLDEMKLVIDTASEPYKTYFWILAETGIRCGEACGLPTKISPQLVEHGDPTGSGFSSLQRTAPLGMPTWCERASCTHYSKS